MTRIAWAAQPVKTKIEALPTHRDRKNARHALRYLRAAEASSYNHFYKKQKRFLAKLQANSDDEGEGEANMKKLRLPLNAIEIEGLECAIWPHLYWRTEMCETAVRASNRAGGDETSSEEDGASSKESEADDSEAERGGKSGHRSLKGSYLAKVLSPVIGYGTDYSLFQFVYDLHMWTMLGAKKNIRQGEVPLRILLKGASFSPVFWRLRHLALIDAQRQLGFPTLFFTMSPYEWSFPYHAWLTDELEKDLRTRLHLLPRKPCTRRIA